MKILGLEINTANKHDSPVVRVVSDKVINDLQKTKPSIPLKRAHPRKELGDSGTRMLHGIITEEYLSNLQGIQGIKVYDEMRKSDGTVRAAMMVTTLPIRRAKWFVNPATDNDQDKEIANFVEHALFDWLEDMTWDDFIRQALLMLPFGVMLFEKVYTTKESDGKTWITLKKLAPRLPKSILQWELIDDTFGIQQIRQDGIVAQIPGSKLVIFVNEREGDNWWGTSMLRAAYKHWYYKNGFYKIDAVAFERQGLGVPKMTMPAGYTESDEKRAETALENLRASEMQYLILPNGYDAEFMNMGASTTRDPEKSINHHDKEILLSVLAQFLELGQSVSKSGSRALSQDHSDLFLKAMESIANNLISTVNKKLIPELIDMNFNNVKVYPVLDFSGISKIDVTALGNAYSNLVKAGALSPTSDDQQYLRAAMGLPPRTQADMDAEANNKPTSEAQADNVDIEEVSNKVDKQNTQTKEQNKKVDKATNDKTKNKASYTLKKVFSDGAGFTSWRPLTMTEKKVNFGTIETNMNKMENEFSVEAKKMLKDAKDKFMAKIQVALDNGETRSISALEIKFVSDYKKLLKDAMQKAYEYGKKNVSNEMDIMTPPSSADSLAHMDVMADTIANKTAVDIESKAKISVINSLKQNTPTLQALGTIDAIIDKVINQSVDTVAGILVGQGINNGRNDVFKRNLGMIRSFQRSEVLDERTCDFCLSIDGLIVSPNDTWANTDIFHGNCRGIWVEILNDEIDPPEITGVPHNIGDYYGGEPNALIQPPKPIIRPGSPAEKVVKERELAKKKK